MKHVNSKLKINLIGETWTLRKFILEENQMNLFLKMAEKLNKPLWEAIVDPFFYHHLKDKKIQTFEDVSQLLFQGLLNNTKNQIEIWYKGKKIQKLIIDELDNSLLLFPLYSVAVGEIPENLYSGIYIEQHEIGLFGSFEIKDLAQFNIEDLEFKLINFQDKMMVQSLSYKGQTMKCYKRETLIVYQNSFEINP